VSKREELRALADAICEESISPEEVDRLVVLLRDDEEAQKFYLSYLDVESSLQVAMRGGLRADVAATRSPRLVLRVAAIAAAAVLLLALGWMFIPRPAPAAAPATLSRVHEAAWGPGQQALVPGARLAAGAYRLVKGIAELRFESGITLVVEGPTTFDILGPWRAGLRSGQLVCRASAGATGFVVETLKADVLDLGTEFGVRVGDSGRTELQVYEGEVVASFKDAGQGKERRRQLLAGQALDMDAEPREATFRPYRFVRTLPGPADPRGRGMHPYNRVHHDELHLVPAPAGVAIDGNLSDWDLSGRYAAACEPPYEAYGAETALMYDSKHLYLGGHVRDPFPMRSQVSPEVPREVYGMGGCVAFRISTDRAMGWPVRGMHADMRAGRPASPEDLSDKLAFVTLWYFQPQNKPCLHVRYGMDLHGTVVNPPGYQGAFRRDPDGQGYTFEYAIPWELLHAADAPPRAGDVLGAMGLVHWSDAQGKTWQGQLIDVANPLEKGWNFYNAGTWGRAIYHPAGRLPADTVRELSPLPPRQDD
jgi:hypothetical protein